MVPRRTFFAEQRTGLPAKSSRATPPVEWPVVCREMLKRHDTGKVLEMPLAVAVNDGPRGPDNDGGGRRGRLSTRFLPASTSQRESCSGAPRTRTGTRGQPQRILSPPRLPVSTERLERCYLPDLIKAFARH